MEDEEVDVLFTEILSGNPYHSLLFDELPSNVKTEEMERYRLFPLLRNVLRRDTDVVHYNWIHSYFFVYNFTGSKYVDAVFTAIFAVAFVIDALLVKMLGVRTVWTVHNKLNHERDYWRSELLVNICLSRIVDVMTVKCSRAEETLGEVYRMSSTEKIRVVPDGNYIPVYPNTVTREEARNRLKIDEDEFVYLYFGVIREYKGVPELVKAYENLNTTDSCLYIVGTPRSEHLKSYLSSASDERDDIKTVLEYVPDEEVQMYMNAADVVVLPFRDVLNSGSVHLSMSFGKPVVAPSLGCIPETVDESNRFLYSPEDENVLREILKKVRDVEDLEQIGDANYAKAEKMTWEKSARKYAEIYDSLT